MLRARCPSATTISTSALSSLTMGGVGGGSFGSSAVVYRLASGDEVGVCYLVNTGEYCSTVVPQLEAMIKVRWV